MKLLNRHFALTLLTLVAGGLSATAVASDSVLLEFSSDGCGPCQAMRPIVSELIATGVPVRQVDVAGEPGLTRRYGIRSTPTYIVLSGGREVTRLTGMQSARNLRQALATSPAGPLTPTTSDFAPAPDFSAAPRFDSAPDRSAPDRSAPDRSAPDRSARHEPQTRLAPLSGHRGGFNHGSSHSIRQSEMWTSQSSQPTVGASPTIESMPSDSLARAVEHAHAATVRLRVHDGRGHGAGTGTIIDTHGEEALVLTCGHLFRDGSPSDRIEVDVFHGGQIVTVEGQLIDFEADVYDIGLVAIRPGVPVQPVPVLNNVETVRVGQMAFSFGCDRGDLPSRRDTRITGVNKYNQNIGAFNLEIEGAPIDGRSGGGLFDEQGRLIGVCNSADYKSDLGIYTGPGSVHWQLDRARLGRLYQSDADDSVAAVIPANNSPSEMIVILRDAAGGQTEQVLTLQGPDAELVQRIRAAARR